MKAKFFFILFLIGSCAFCQVPSGLESSVKKLYTACHDIDISALTDMLCTSNDNAYNVLDGYFLNEDSKFRYVFTNVKYKYGPIKVVDGKSYCRIDFRNVVRVTYFKPIAVESTQAALKDKFPATSISYDKSRNAFLIVYNAKMAAVSESAGIWKFAFADNTFPQVSQGCLTENVKKELGL
ncbi:MAG: hypothetical protein EOO48_08230 [Flavobacterium sp.]|nr:MAG: hypothetical protein EOO48_08230 [Flavobacterium sp.]